MSFAARFRSGGLWHDSRVAWNAIANGAMLENGPRDAADPRESDEDRVRRYRLTLATKPAIRVVYEQWYAEIAEQLASGRPTVELGCGHGALRNYMPDSILTDVFRSPYADFVCDAQQLPFADDAVANFVMVDVLHHVRRPLDAFREMARCLRVGGRIVISEPYLSPVARVAFRFHHEGIDFQERLESGGSQDSDPASTEPFRGNMALAHKALVTELPTVLQAARELRLEHREFTDWLVYPLSGGMNYRPLLPAALARTLIRLERRSGRVARWIGFKVLAVFEKATKGSGTARSCGAGLDP